MRKYKLSLPFLLLSLLFFSVSQAQVLQKQNDRSAVAGKKIQSYKKGALLYKDDFDAGLDNWVAEAPATAGSKVAVENKKLLIDVDGGATVWLNKKLFGNILIEYKRKVLAGTGKNDRLSDLNQFWMASDPQNENLFTRTGIFSEYDSLQLYYVGFGGNTNTTTRFRKYTGNGDRVLYQDLTDKEHLLEPNKEYTIKIVVHKGLTKFFVDDKEFFSFLDPDPLQEGYFGFRTVQSRQEIDDFRVYKLE
jgi:rhamnogalacturonan endolyase